MGHLKPVITKRISRDFEPFRPDAENLKDEIFNNRFILITKYFKEKYKLTLADAVNFSVAFIGVFNNREATGARYWTTERYERGMRVRQALVNASEKL